MIKIPVRFQTLYNIVSFQACWWANVLLLQSGMDMAAYGVSGVYLILHFSLLSQNVLKELVFVGVGGLIGYLADSVFAWSGLLVFDGGVLAPFWLLFIWWMFLSTFFHSFSWLQNKPSLCFAFGAVGGPVTYYAASRFELFNYEQPIWLALLAHGVLWGFLLWVLFKGKVKYAA